MFYNGDEVCYTGSRLRSMQGERGTVCGKVQNDDTELVVDFNGDAYVVSFNELVKYNPAIHKSRERKEEKDKKKKLEVEVKRKLDKFSFEEEDE